MRRSTTLRSCSRLWGGVLLGLAATLLPATSASAQSPDATAQEIIELSGFQGGLVVHLGCGNGELTAGLGSEENCLVQGLDTDPKNVRAARQTIQTAGTYGRVSVDLLRSARLPYIENVVNLLVVEELGAVPAEEGLRVLAPGGTACVKRNGRWTPFVKPRPDTLDDWGHYMHDPSNNAVAHDTVIGPPRRLQWLGSPRYSRHHDHMSSVSAVVSSGGRVFYIVDEASPTSILTAAQWSLVARDAFSGTVLWKRPMESWHTHLWKLKSGPAQLPRRLVAEGDRVYVTLAIDGPVHALDAATGETVNTYEGTRGAEEILLADGIVLALARKEGTNVVAPQNAGRAYGKRFWDETPRELVAVEAASGTTLWTDRRVVLPGTLTADSKRVLFHDGESVVCLDQKTGVQRWASEPIARTEEIKGFYIPILLLYEDVVLFAGGETAGMQTGSWYTEGEDTVTALSADTGEKLWSAYHPPSGYRSPEDMFVINGLVWTGETTSGRAEGVFCGRDPRTGEIKSQFSPDVDTYWFHHRCYRGKATDNFMLTARTGTEFIDVRNESWDINHWVRGACLYGVMPANGLLYAPQHPCACYLESKLYGFNALAPAGSADATRIPSDLVRLLKGPAYNATITGTASSSKDDWPTLRHDTARSGSSSTSVPTDLAVQWKADIGGRVSSPVAAEGKVFVAAIDQHAVHAIDVATGKNAWTFHAGGRVDSPPTIYQGRAIFGSADGSVYCVRVSDGQLVWRFLAALTDERSMVFEQIESVWPVHGSVLVENDTVYCVAGRSMFLDGGLRLWRLDPKTGEALSETVMDGSTKTAEDPQEHTSWLNMPVALPDVLSTDGQFVYMRSQPFRMDGTRLPLEAMPAGEDADMGAPPPSQSVKHAHLFSPTGFLDDTWWHRTYWIYGSRFVSGWCGYFLAGKAAPAGRIMVFDEETIYGFGRQPQYFRWTTPIEHHLFATSHNLAEFTKADVEKPMAAPFKIEHQWSEPLPLLARSMVLAGKTLFVAGPPDLVDEPQAFKQIGSPVVQELLAEQVEANEGNRGGSLWAVSTSDGKKLSEVALDTAPIFDGLIAAGGRLYASMQDGSVVCLGAAK